MITSRAFGAYENWTLTLWAITVGTFMYVLRAIDGAGWSLKATTITAIALAALLCFLIGENALVFIGVYVMIDAWWGTKRLRVST